MLRHVVEHLRPAEASEISEMLKIKAAMGDIQALIDEDRKLDVGFAPGEVEDGDKANREDPLLELFDEGTAEEDLEGEFVQLENMDWEEVAERRRKCLDDVPVQVKKQRAARSLALTHRMLVATAPDRGCPDHLTKVGVHNCRRAEAQAVWQVKATRHPQPKAAY